MKKEYIAVLVIILILLIVFYYVTVKPVIENIDEIAKLAAKANKFI